MMLGLSLRQWLTAALLLCGAGVLVFVPRHLAATSGELIAHHRVTELTPGKPPREHRTFALTLELDVNMAPLAVDLQCEAGVRLPEWSPWLEAADGTRLRSSPGGSRSGPTGASRTVVYEVVATGPHRIRVPMLEDPARTTLRVRARVWLPSNMLSLLGVALGGAGIVVVMLGVTRHAARLRQMAMELTGSGELDERRR